MGNDQVESIINSISPNYNQERLNTEPERLNTEPERQITEPEVVKNPELEQPQHLVTEPEVKETFIPDPSINLKTKTVPQVTIKMNIQEIQAQQPKYEIDEADIKINDFTRHSKSVSESLFA